MGRRGPKPKATALQMAKGDPGKRAKRREGIEPRPEGLLPGPVVVGEGEGEPRVMENYAEPPTDVDGNAILDANGQAMWREIVQACDVVSKQIKMDWLTKLDRGLLTSYCLNWSVLCSVAAEAQESPTYLERNEGGLTLKVSPYLKAAQLAMGQMKTLAAEFGFSPSARARLTLGAKGDAAGALLDRYLAEGKG